MSLTPAQLQVLKADIVADPVLRLQPMNSDGAVAIAAVYNGPDATNADAWRTSMTLDEVLAGVTWTEYIARTQGERDAFDMMTSTGTINPARVNIRQGFADIFSGAGGVLTRTALTAAAKRKMTRAERLFATGPTGGAFDLTLDGALAYQDVQRAREL